MRCPVGAVKPSRAQSAGDVWGGGVFFFAFCMFLFSKNTLGFPRGNFGRQTSGLGSASCISCREKEPRKPPRWRRRIAAFCRAREKEFAGSSQRVVCALPGCLFQVHFSGEWRSEAASEAGKTSPMPCGDRCCRSGVVSPRL